MIGIKDFEMPYNCFNCELHNYHECNLTSESIEDDYCWNGDSREKHCPLVGAIPIPKDATNGDILRTIFPKAKHELQKFYEEDTIVFDLDGFYMRISSDWWNSPYKE